MATLKHVIIYTQFAVVMSIIIGSMFIRWHYTLALTHVLSFPFGSSLLGLALDGDNKSRPTQFQSAIQAFASFISLIATGLLVAQIAVIIAYEGNLPHDPNPLSPLIYQQDFDMMITVLVIAALLTIVEAGRFVFYICRKKFSK